MSGLQRFVRGFDDVIAAIFDWVNNSWVTAIATLVPVTTLFIPAYIIYIDIRGIYSLSEIAEMAKNSGTLGTIVGFNVFGTGIALTSTFFMFYSYSRSTSSRTKKEEKIPLWVLLTPIGLYIMYFVIVIMINVILRNADLLTAKGVQNALFTINILLIALEIPAVVIASLRVWYSGLEKKKEKKDDDTQYVTYDYRTATSGWSLEEFKALRDSGKAGILAKFPNMHPERPAKWLKNYLPRDIERLENE